MSSLMDTRKILIARILEGPGHASHTLRRGAFENAGLEEPVKTLIQKVAKCAREVTDEDLAAARTAGLDEDQIFEIIVCGAVGQATRQHDNALAALKEAAGKV